IDLFVDTSRPIDFHKKPSMAEKTDVLRRYQDRETRYSISYIPFVYETYLEGPAPEAPSRSEDEVTARLAEIDTEISRLEKAAKKGKGDPAAVESLEKERAALEADKKKIDVVKSREDAALKAAKKAAEDVKKEILDRTAEQNGAIGKDIM